MPRPVAFARRALGLGDFLTGLPALALLRQALPHHSVVLAAPSVPAPLVPYVPAIDHLVATGELMPVDRHYAGVDVAVDLHGKGPESRRLLAELEPARLVAFDDPGAGFPREVAGGRPRVHPGAAAESRRWPPDRFAQVAAQLGREGHRVVITGGPAERALAERGAAASGVAT